EADERAEDDGERHGPAGAHERVIKIRERVRSPADALDRLRAGSRGADGSAGGGTSQARTRAQRVPQAVSMVIERAGDAARVDRERDARRARRDARALAETSHRRVGESIDDRVRVVVRETF